MSVMNSINMYWIALHELTVFFVRWVNKAFLLRALAQVMRQTAPGEHVEREESLVVHRQQYENMQARATGNNLRK